MRTAEKDVGTALDRVAEESGFSGVVRVEGGGWLLERAYGAADRAHGVAMTVDTRIGVASGAKTFTALAVLGLVERDVLRLDTRARELLRDDLPQVDDAVTVEQLLSHRSGIGDYLDEEAGEAADYELPVPVHTLDTAESYLTVLDGFPQKFAPGSGFAYCNAGYCVLALLAERAAAHPFHDLVRRLVIEPAGLTRTAYLRSDELPGDAAWGYLETTGLRTNVLRLPVVGGGDGGIFTTAGDVARLWSALEAGAVVSPETWALMREVRGTDADGDGYGLGLWLGPGWQALVGSDVGATFHAVRAPGRASWSVLCNVTAGAWPVSKRLGELLLPEDP